jgi:Ca2+-binding RTX toxin-like protein
VRATRALVALGIAVALVLSWAAPATASGTAARTLSTITYQHTGGTSDHVTITSDGGLIVITVDEGVVAGSGCSMIDPSSVSCAPSPLVAVTGGDFDDTLEAKELLGGVAARLGGGGGADHLTGNSGANTLDGGAGNDVVDGGEGADTITGGPGSDTLTAGGGDDVVDSRDGEVDIVDCGPGADTATADAGDVLTGCEAQQLPAPVKVTATFTFKVKDRTADGVLVKKLVVGGLTAADAVAVACKGKDCPFKSKVGKVAGGKSKLTKLFKKHRVKKLTLTVTVTRAGATGVVETFKLKKGKVRSSIQCLPPGSTSPVSC